MSADIPDAAAPSVGATARGGARTSLATQVAIQIGSAGATIILARVLTKSDFGIIAAAQSVLGLATLLGLGSITAALVTRPGDVHGRASSYFWTALLAGGAMAILLCMVAGPITTALGQPHAAAYLRALTLTLPLSLLSMVPQALLQRQVRFHALNATLLIAALVYFATEVILALLGWGAWSVIVGQIAGGLAGFCLSVILARFVPTRRPRFREVWDDAAIIGNMSMSSFFAYLGKNVDYWVVSRILGGGALGVYYIAYVLPSIIRVRISGIFRQVMLPVLARLDDPVDQARTWCTALRRTLILLLPAMTLLAAVSEPLVLTLFGAQWREAAGPMRLITIAGMADVIFAAASTMAVARGHLVTRSTIMLGIRAAFIAVGCVVAALKAQNTTAVAAAVLGAAVITLVIQEFTLARPLGIGTGGLGWGVARVALACVLSYTIVSLTLSQTHDELQPIWALTLGAVMGVLTLVTLSALLCPRELSQARNEARSFFRP